MGSERVTLVVETESGPFLTQFTRRGLVRVRFPDLVSGRIAEPEVADSCDLDIPETWCEQVEKGIQAALQGQVVNSLPPLDFLGTPFQLRVWEALLAIPLGQTRTYGDIATSLGKPGAARAVGRACGANPIPLLVPCHRVLASGSAIGGFSGGCGWKPLLLEREGWTSGSDLPLFQDRNQTDSA